MSFFSNPKEYEFLTKTIGCTSASNQKSSTKNNNQSKANHSLLDKSYSSSKLGKKKNFAIKSS